jgi:hypothetical protein
MSETGLGSPTGNLVDLGGPGAGVHIARASRAHYADVAEESQVPS